MIEHGTSLWRSKGKEKTGVRIEEIPDPYAKSAHIYIMENGFGGERVEDGKFTAKAEIGGEALKR